MEGACCAWAYTCVICAGRRDVVFSDAIGDEGSVVRKGRPPNGLMRVQDKHIFERCAAVKHHQPMASIGYTPSFPEDSSRNASVALLSYY
jgi:hypothetical protein